MMSVTIPLAWETLEYNLPWPVNWRIVSGCIVCSPLPSSTPLVQRPLLSLRTAPLKPASNPASCYPLLLLSCIPLLTFPGNLKSYCYFHHHRSMVQLPQCTISYPHLLQVYIPPSIFLRFDSPHLLPHTPPFPTLQLPFLIFLTLSVSLQTLLFAWEQRAGLNWLYRNYIQVVTVLLGCQGQMRWRRSWVWTCN